MGLFIHLTWLELAVRLGLAFAAGGLIGLNRERHGHPAGLRTTILVCLAACVAMLQADLLLPLAGKRPDGFAVMDLMRLPLGILTGIGFIGGGAIVKRGSLVVGVTTAATVWIATVIGLCFGGGQLGLGLAATGLTFIVLAGMKGLDERMPKLRRASLTVDSAPGQAPAELSAADLGVKSLDLVRRSWSDRGLTSHYRLLYADDPSALARRVAKLAREPGVVEVKWSDEMVE